jgi:hypothetical protein
MLSLIINIIYTAPSILAINKCPNYKDIMDARSLSEFNQTQYQGEWYMVADTEPSEPAFCHCDRFTWIFNILKPKEFESKQQTTCTIAGKDLSITLPLSGLLAQDLDYPGLRSEGSPPIAKWIPNMVLYIERDPLVYNQTGYEYSAALVYSCKEKYLLREKFESIQVFSRIPALDDAKIDKLLQKAKDLGLVIDQKVVHRRQNGYNCEYPQSILPPNFIKS